MKQTTEHSVPQMTPGKARNASRMAEISRPHFDSAYQKGLMGVSCRVLEERRIEIATSGQEVIDYTALDNVLLAKVKDLFTRLYKRGEKVRLLGVRFSHLIPMTMQMSLFDDTEEKLELFKTVDQIKNLFGSGAVMKATSLKGKAPKNEENPGS